MRFRVESYARRPLTSLRYQSYGQCSVVIEVVALKHNLGTAFSKLLYVLSSIKCLRSTTTVLKRETTSTAACAFAARGKALQKRWERSGLAAEPSLAEGQIREVRLCESLEPGLCCSRKHISR